MSGGWVVPAAVPQSPPSQGRFFRDVGELEWDTDSLRRTLSGLDLGCRSDSGWGGRAGRALRRRGGDAHVEDATMVDANAGCSDEVADHPMTTVVSTAPSSSGPTQGAGDGGSGFAGKPLGGGRSSSPRPMMEEAGEANRGVAGWKTPISEVRASGDRSMDDGAVVALSKGQEGWAHRLDDNGRRRIGFGGRREEDNFLDPHHFYGYDSSNEHLHHHHRFQGGGGGDGKGVWPLWKPYSLSTSLREVLEIVVVGIGLFCALALFYALIQDVGSKVELKIQQAAQESSECALEYQRNRCHPSDRVPALDVQCGEWEICMHRKGPGVSEKTSVIAQTIGHTFNVFMDQLSLKSVIVVCAILVLSLRSSLLPILVGKRVADFVQPSPTPPPAGCHGGSCAMHSLPPGVGYTAYPRHPPPPNWGEGGPSGPR